MAKAKKKRVRCRRKTVTVEGVKVTLPCKVKSFGPKQLAVAKRMVTQKNWNKAKRWPKRCKLVFFTANRAAVRCEGGSLKSRAKNRWRRGCIRRNSKTGLFYRKAGCKD